MKRQRWDRNGAGSFARQRPTGFRRLRLEWLEDRRMLAALPGPEGDDGVFGVREVINAGAIRSHDDALDALRSGGGTIVDHTAAVLNIQDSGPRGHADGDDQFGVVTAAHRAYGAVDDLALVAKGSVYVETEDDYTFLVYSDDSFRLAIDDLYVGGYDGYNVDTFMTVPLTAGAHSIQLTYHEGTGGAGVELLAARGEKTAYDETFRLIGDTTPINVPGGVPAGQMAGDWQIKEAAYKDYTWLENISDAAALLAITDTSVAKIVEYSSPTVNFKDPDDPGGEGHFGSAGRAPFAIDDQTPYEDFYQDGKDEVFAMRATGALQVDAAGVYSLGVRSDDGFLLNLDDSRASFLSAVGDGTANGQVMQYQGTTADSNTIGHVFFPAPGIWPLTLMYFERFGGAFVELSGTVGQKDDWDSTFTLLGGTPREGYVIPGGLQLVGPAKDFGDAPDPGYPTLAANDGARHTIVPGFYLGNGVDMELDGQPEKEALGDDNDGNDDEDGVTFTSPLTPGETATVEVTASMAGMLDAWIDLNDDGDWADPGEQIFSSQPLSATANRLTFDVPASATLTEQTFARFRLSTAGGLSFDGPADDGEVEDCAVSVELFQPQLIKDINQDTASALISYDEIADVNGTVFFTADDGVRGRELWKSDGTSEGTILVKGFGDGSPSGLTKVGDLLFFESWDADNGGMLWKSDGTEGGTVMLRAFGPDAVPLDDLIAVGGTLFFAAEGTTDPLVLWKSDGTEAGTVMVKDVRADDLIDANGRVFFAGNDGVHGWELWKSDGTAAGTVMVKDVNPSDDSIRVDFTSTLTNVNGTVFFVADDGSTGLEL